MTAVFELKGTALIVMPVVLLWDMARYRASPVLTAQFWKASGVRADVYWQLKMRLLSRLQLKGELFESPSGATTVD